MTGVAARTEPANAPDPDTSTARLARRLTVTAVAAYVAATALGVAMRLQYVGIVIPVPFDHLLHAHSHTLYFGWAGLAILTGAIASTGRRSKPLTATGTMLVASPLAIGVGFLAVGYHLATIAISTVVMLAWYVAIAAWWASTRHVRSVGHTALRAAMGYLVAASGGVWVLAALQATGRGTPLTEALAVHAFVGGFGWFMVFGVVGLVVLNARRLDLTFDESTVCSAIRVWVSLAWITFPLGVVGGPETAIIGPASRFAGLTLTVPAWIWLRALWNAGPPTRRGPWRVIAAWFGLATLTQASVAVLGSQALIAGGRQAVVIHLHALLVGFVTGALVTILLGGRPHVGIRLHHGALAVMLAGLAVVETGAARTGMWIAAGGAIVLWAAGTIWTAGTIRRTLPGPAQTL